MKERIGVVSWVQDGFEPYKQMFPDTHFHVATTVMDLYVILRSHKPYLIVFIGFDTPGVEGDLYSSMLYLRKKAEYSRTPFLVLPQDPKFTLKRPFRDLLVRTFPTGDGLFLRMVEFVARARTPEALEAPYQLDANMVEKSLAAAAQKKLGVSSDFEIRPATDDEAHAQFICQQSVEIPTSRFWVRYTIRILEDGNPAFMAMFKNFTDEERETLSEQLLQKVIQEFMIDIDAAIKKEGAVAFLPSDSLEFEDRKPFIKSAINKTLIFKNDACCLLLDSTQWI